MYRTGTTSAMVNGCQLRLFPSDGDLPQCFGLLLDDIALIRSAAIDSEAKCAAFIGLVQRLQCERGWQHIPLRVSSMQLNNLSHEWSFIQEQHGCFVKANQTAKLDIAHVSLPTNSLYYKIPEHFKSEIVQQALLQLVHQFNAQAGATYCKWVCEDIEVALKSFKPEASEEYTLQASFDDFCHEVHSHLWLELKAEHNAAVLAHREAGLQGDEKRMFELEKTIVACRKMLLSGLKFQYALLVQIASGIAFIEKVHPELKGIRIAATLLHLLMGFQLLIPSATVLGWGQKMLLVQLLDQQLHVISAVNGYTGFERTNLVFSIRLALAEMSKSVSIDELLAFCLDWHAEKEEKLGRQLRVWTWQNYKLLNIPSQVKSAKEGIFNAELISFLPRKVSVHSGGMTKIMPLLVYDQETGAATAFTAVGERLLDL